MSETITFLKERIAKAQRELENNPHFREMKILEKIISELSEPIKSSEEKVIQEEVLRKTKDFRNSPLPEMKYGERMPYIYNKVEELVKQSNGIAEVGVLVKRLRDEFGISWKGDEATHTGLTNYIAGFNRNRPSIQRLELLPKKIEGKKMKKYLYISYIGKEDKPTLATIKPEEKPKRTLNLSPEERKRRGDRIRAYHNAYVAKKNLVDVSPLLEKFQGAGV